jgi:non-specific serine/threonine protein kinase
MRDAIAWSYGLLTAEEAQFFRALAVFVGGFTLDAAECVEGEGLSAFDLLTALVDKSLIRRTEVAGRTRFQMLETIREFAQEQAATAGDLTRVGARHAAWYRRLADEIRQSGQLSQARGLQTLETELPNLRAAMTWFLGRGETESALHLTGQLAEFWLRHGHCTEGQAWLERALASGSDAPSAARAAALVGLALMHWPQNEFARAEEVLREAERVAQAAGDPGALAYARLHQGYVAYFQGDVETMTARAEEHLSAIALIPQGFGQHPSLWLLASAALARGDDERAFELNQRLLVSARGSGDEISLANALRGIAAVAARQGEFRLALSSFVEAATVCQHLGDWQQGSYCVDGAATVALAQGRLQSAVRLFASAEEQRLAVGGMRQTILIYQQAKAEATQSFLAAFGAERLRTTKDAGAALALPEAIDEITALAQDQTLPVSGLTARERDVLHHLVAGASDKEIAELLGISSRTVSKHVITIRTKLAAPSRTAAAAIAIRDHLV